MLCVGLQTKGHFPTGINKVLHCHYYSLNHTGIVTPNPSNDGIIHYILSDTGIQSLKLAYPGQLVVPQVKNM